MSAYVYGWRKDLPDRRDSKFVNTLKGAPVTLAPVVDLRPKMPPVYNQGQLGSCTANGIGAALEYDEIVQTGKGTMPSRLFIYYNERALEGTVSEDAGAAIRDGVKVVHKYGAAPEKVWPYVIARFTQRPPATAYAAAKKFAALRYHSVNPTVTELQTALSLGRPVVFGFTVYSYFESVEMAQQGVLNVPQPDESVLGGHCVVVAGYDTTREPGKVWFLVRNSWGAGWGKAGYFWMSEDYITDPYLASDFWVIDSVGALPGGADAVKVSFWDRVLHWFGL